MIQTEPSQRNPLEDYALAMRHRAHLLAAVIAHRNGLGADFVGEAAFRALGRLAELGFRDEAENVALTFDAELREHVGVLEVERALAAALRRGMDDVDDDPTEPDLRIGDLFPGEEATRPEIPSLVRAEKAAENGGAERMPSDDA